MQLFIGFYLILFYKDRGSVAIGRGYQEVIVEDGRLKRGGEGGELLSSCLFPARSRWIFSLRRRAGEYRVKYFLFLPKMFSHFWLRNKKVLGRKGARFCLEKSKILGRVLSSLRLSENVGAS